MNRIQYMVHLGKQNKVVGKGNNCEDVVGYSTRNMKNYDDLGNEFSHEKQLDDNLSSKENNDFEQECQRDGIIPADRNENVMRWLMDVENPTATVNLCHDSMKFTFLESNDNFVSQTEELHELKVVSESLSENKSSDTLIGTDSVPDDTPPTLFDLSEVIPVASKIVFSDIVKRSKPSDVIILQNVELAPARTNSDLGIPVVNNGNHGVANRQSAENGGINNESMNTDLLAANISSLSNITVSKDDYFDNLSQLMDSDDSVKDPNYSPPQSETSLDSLSILDQNDIDDIVLDPHIHVGETIDNPTSNIELKSIMANPPSGTSELLESLETPGVEQVMKSNYKDRMDFCIFCDKDVSHFARHMYTWHEQEFDIQKIQALNKNSPTRRQLLCDLRKRGNFVKNKMKNVKLRPVKRLEAANSTNLISSDDFLPCPHCYGFYKKNSLYRHSKLCHKNKDPGRRQTVQSDGQTTLLMSSRHKHQELLKTVLFPRMRADNISLIAKSDPLICSYGYSYLKGRRSKGNFDLVKQNMRRLAKLLKFAKERKPDIKHLMDVLRPCYFELVISAVNEMALYNHETEKYESPTLALNFGTLLKKCCDLAFIQLLQEQNTDARRKDMKILKTLIESQWANEVSAQAATNLNENKWNKNELLPLTSDLKKLNIYLEETAEESFKSLKNNETDKMAYTTLKETLYSGIILLNRRRPAEVAQLKVQTYQSIDLDHRDKNSEFQNCLTETELILLNTYSRLVIRGKRGRGVPIILSPNMKKHLDLIVKVRNNFAQGNDYIFHSGGERCIDGTKVLYKYAQKCGAERAKSISATRLRKHLATITQLLHFSNNDLEQLSKFMGHTLKTHCDVYRMSDDMYQTAKVSKLLLLMREGGAEQFKDKTLDEINFDMTPVTDDNDLEGMTTEIESEPVDVIMNETMTSKSQSVPSGSGIRDVEPKCTKKGNHKKIVGRMNWTKKQKQVISEYFADHIRHKRSPKRFEVEDFVKLNPDMNSIKWSTIKAVVYNMYTHKLKM